MTINRLILPLLIVVCCALPTNVPADTIVLNDGRQFNGTFVSETDDVIVFDVRSGGATIRAKYSKANVANVERDVKEGPGYYALPIVGPIGFQEGVDTFVSADAFRKALDKVRSSGAEYVVLVIDTPGGSIDEMNKIIDAIDQASDLRFIAYVKQALSAGAVIAMACPEIFMAPRGTIGAAVAYRMTPDGTPANIEEKMQSAIRARFRQVASTGDHSLLLLRGMSESEIELSIKLDEDKPTIIEGVSEESKLFKAKGQILTLTALEANACDLAIATLPDIDSIKKYIGATAWHLVDDQAWHDMTNHGRAMLWKQEDADRRRLEAALILEEVERVEPRLLELESSVLAAEITELELKSERDRRLSNLRKTYNLLVADAVAARVSTTALDSEYSTQRTRITREFDNQIRDVRETRNANALQAKSLRRQLNDLVKEFRQKTAGL